MKRTDYRPNEFKTMDPSSRYNLWSFEKRTGHLFTDARRIANFQSAVLAIAIGSIYGLSILSGENFILSIKQESDDRECWPTFVGVVYFPEKIGR